MNKLIDAFRVVVEPLRFMIARNSRRIEELAQTPIEDILPSTVPVMPSTPTASDSGKIPMVQEDGSWGLGEVPSDSGGGSGGGSGVASNELHVNLTFDMDANTFTSDVSVNDAYDWWMNKGPVYVHFNEYASIKVHTVLGSDRGKTLEFYQLVRMDSQGFDIVIYQWCSTPDGDRFYMEEVHYGSGEQRSYTEWNGKE